MSTQDLLKDVKLRFSTDRKLGYSRKVSGKNFLYFNTEGNLITDTSIIARINSLAFPPAYKKVWICPYENGYLQATGYDDRHRKQYRYHPLWNKASQTEKFSHITEFAKELPKIREKIKADLSVEKLSKQKVIAAVVWLLENTLIRIGNEEYAQDNKSYGLTTLQNKHVSIYSGNIRFRFKGKSGVYHNISIKNKKVARIIRSCRDLPGQDLFEFVDSEGEVQTVSSQDVNTYLQEITGKDITAKDFRTWGGTVFAAIVFDRTGILEDEARKKQSVADAVKKVSEHLRNKPNTCKKYYIHPHIITAYLNGYSLSNFKDLDDIKKYKKVEGLDDYENKVLHMVSHMNDHKLSSS